MGWKEGQGIGPRVKKRKKKKKEKKGMEVGGKVQHIVTYHSPKCEEERKGTERFHMSGVKMYGSSFRVKECENFFCVPGVKVYDCSVSCNVKTVSVSGKKLYSFSV